MGDRKYAKTPTVFQMEVTECGAASLSMILGYFGKFVPLEEMRIECGVSRNGCNAKNLLLAGRKYGLEVHGYRKELEGLLKMPVPSIIHWEFNHFVVFEGIKGKYCYINDPAKGRRKLSMEELGNGFTGVVLTFKKTPEFKAGGKADSLFYFVKKRLTGQREAVMAIVVIGLMLIFPGIFISAFSQIFIDGILVEGNTGWIFGLVISMIFTLVFRMFLTYYRGILMLRLQNKLSLISAHEFLEHMFRLPMNFFTQRYAGDLSRRVENNNDISVFLTSDVAQTILNIIVALFYLVVLMIYSPLLTLIGLGIAILNLLITRVCSMAVEDLALIHQQDEGKLRGRLFAGLMVSGALKASGTENEYAGRLQGYYANSIATGQELGKRQQALDAIPDVCEEVTSILILMVGGILIIRGTMTEGMLVAFSSLFISFIEPINELAGFTTRIQTAKADMRRVDDIMKYQEEKRHSEEQLSDIRTKLEGNVTLKSVSFGYSVLEAPLIEDFSFNIPCGSSLAFVGESGSGKSTISKICSGLYRPWGGQIFFDKIPMDQIPDEVLSASVSFVSQEIVLLSGSIRDNLTMWNRNILEADMIRAAKDACIHDVITSRPGAYDSLVLEDGANFSGGQKQRLEIARALATNPSILIMDEATSALDPITEKEIMDNIKRRGCTCIIVAHRLSAIRDCDEIIVMDHGKVVQRGRHEEMASTEGQYRDLVQVNS